MRAPGRKSRSAVDAAQPVAVAPGVVDIVDRAVLEGELPADTYGRLLLAPGAQAPIQVAARSPQICTCFNVSEDTIRSELPRCGGADDQRLAQLQGQLRCGTNCGSCIPELRRLVKAVPASLVAI